MFKAMEDYVQEDLGIEVPEGTLDGAWFNSHNLPMVVQCRCCETSMVLFSAWVDEEGFCYCPQCAGE